MSGFCEYALSAENNKMITINFVEFLSIELIICETLCDFTLCNSVLLLRETLCDFTLCNSVLVSSSYLIILFYA